MAELPSIPSPDSTPDLLTRFAQGEPIADIAKALQVHPSTLYRHMLRAGGPTQYYEAKVAANQVRIWEADEALEKAKDMLEYNKAHARAKLTRLDYERTCPQEYGPKQELSVDTRVTVILNQPPPPVTPVIDITPEQNMSTSVSAQEVKEKVTE